MSLDRIEIVGIEEFGYHGCLQEERVKGQIFIVDAALFLDLAKPGKSDDLNDTVNYAEVTAEIKKIIAGQPVKLIETVADRIATMILTKYDLVEKVEIKLHKPQAPVDAVFKDINISIQRSR